MKSKGKSTSHSKIRQVSFFPPADSVGAKWLSVLLSTVSLGRARLSVRETASFSSRFSRTWGPPGCKNSRLGCKQIGRLPRMGFDVGCGGNKRLSRSCGRARTHARRGTHARTDGHARTPTGPAPHLCGPKYALCTMLEYTFAFVFLGLF